MNETTHTPGPWMMNTDKEVWHTLGPGGLVAVVVDQQDAHIVAAAPDLLAACEEIAANSSCAFSINAARAAIAKAKGGAV